jgi:hypothetical protein
MRRLSHLFPLWRRLDADNEYTIFILVTYTMNLYAETKKKVKEIVTPLKPRRFAARGEV